MPDPADRRAAERFPVSAHTSVDFLSPVVENFGPVKIKNVSTDGIGLLANRKVEAGQLLAITLSNPSQKFSKTLMVRVAHVTATGGTFLIGGTFSPPLTYDELKSLVF